MTPPVARTALAPWGGAQTVLDRYEAGVRMATNLQLTFAGAVNVEPLRTVASTLAGVTRDVGAAMQELYLEQSGTKQWSSDACGHQGGNADVRSLQPNLELEYYQVWEGKSTAGGCTAQPLAKPGTYQLRGRLGNKVSEPVTITITA